MAKDVFHQQVKNALIKDGWIITNDPLYIRISDAVKVQIDLAAENAIAAERDTEKIAVEIKSFIAGSVSMNFTQPLVNTLITVSHWRKINQIELFI